MVTMDVFEIEFHAWSIVFLWKNGLFIGENYNAKREDAKSLCCSNSEKNSWVY